MNPELSFGSFVKKHRMALGLTQAELAARVGCATVTLRKIEGDTLRPSVQISERLAMALDIPLEERGEFVRLARTALLGTPEPPSVPTPSPRPEEIGEEDLTGRAVRGYELGERIGSGGFGAVYRAVQPGVEREVALKIILPQYANHPDFVRRFEAEAHLVARLEHPHIVPLYDYWREPNAAFLVMRLLRGGSLNQMLKQGPLSLEFVLRIVEQIGAALHTAHRFGVIHRDLKPANILLDEDQNAYLADFGIAKNLGNPNLEEQTQAGAWIGSPAYISPEQIRSESILPQADIYCMGVMLYELLTSQQPFKGPTPIDYIMQHLKQPLPPLADCNPNAPAALNPIIQRATAKDPHARFPDMPSMLAAIREVFPGPAGVEAAWPGADESGVHAPEDLENPYKGLRPFGEADAEDFFGRKALIQEMLGHLAEETDVSRFLAVVGPSGSGKSSVVKAGLIPAIRRGALPGSENWFVVDFLPGSHPLEELEAALLRIAVNPPESLLGQLKEDERGLLRAVKRILPTDQSVELVLVIDQFEEVFTLVQDEATRAHFLNSLVAVVLESRSRVRVILTLRADFTDRPLQYVDFGELLRQRTEFVLPLTPDELELAITGPTKKAGLLLEPGLTARIVRELGDQPGTLPLLQYALTELFERRVGRKLTLSAYDEIGGVLGALGRRAEDIYAGLDELGQAAARQLFLRLVTLGEGVEDTRRRVLRSELASLDSKRHLESTKSTKPHEEKLRELSELSGSKLASVIEAFGKARLLTFDRDPVTRGPTVEVAHEALLREWPRLRGWLTESRTDVRMQRTLGSLAAEWQATQDASFLLRGARLNQFASWGETTTMALTNDERAFLEASLQARQDGEAAELVRQEREHALEQRSRNFLRGLVGVFAVATAVALFLSIFAFNQRGIAQSEASSRATQQVIAEEQAALAATSAAEANVNADLAATREVEAITNANLAATRQAEAEAEAIARATAEAIAIAEREAAESQRLLAVSRELSLYANNALETDPELSILLSLQALRTSYTEEAESALHQALQQSRLRFTLTDHTDWVWSAQYTPDGNHLATLSFDRTIKVWDTRTWQVEQTIPFLGWHMVWVKLYINPDGTTLATVTTDENLETVTFQSWDIASGEPQLTYTLPIALDESYPDVALSPDWTKLAVGYNNGTAELWDIAAVQKLVTFIGHADWVWSVPFSPDGTRLVTLSRDGTVRVWDVVASLATGSGQEITSFQTTSGGDLNIAAFYADGSHLALAFANGLVEVWDLADTSQPQLSLTGHANLARSISFNADESQMVTASQDGTAKVWDLTNGDLLYTLSGHNRSVISAIFSPDDRQIVTTSLDQTVRIWDAQVGTKGELLTLDTGAFNVDLDLSPDEKLLALGSFNGPATIWNAATGELVWTLSGDFGGVYRVDFSSDGTKVATGGEDNVTRVWDILTGNTILTFTGHGEGFSVGGLYTGITDIAFSPDGTRLASAGADGVAKVWDIQTGTAVLTISSQGPGLRSVIFSPDGNWIVTSSDEDDAKVNVWDATSGAEIYTLMGHEARVWGLAFNHNQSLLATSGPEGIVKVWDMATGAELYNLPGQVSTVGSVVFSPDGQRLYSASGDGIRVWDMATGEEILLLSPNLAFAIALNRDGTHLFATTFQVGGVGVYAVNYEEALAVALIRVTRWFTPEECLQYLHTDTCPPDIRP